MANYKLEQYSSVSEEFSNLAENIFSDLSSVWNSSSEKKVSLYRLTSGPNGEKAFFSPNLKSSDGAKCLGYFESNGYYGRILLSEELLSEAVSYETFREVVSHEFAHFVDYTIFNHVGHDGTFKTVCEILGIENNGVALKNSLTEVAKTSSVLEKIKKLLALSESSNINESQAALLKAQTLMREYGISERESSTEKIYRVILTPYNSYTTEISTITHIVKEISNCWLLLSQGKIDDKQTNIIYAHGTKTECELASYLFDYLKRELKYHYLQAKREQNLSYGAKKSFYLGVEHEIIKKLKTQEAETGNKSLVQYDKENEEASKELIYKSAKFSFSTKLVSAAIRNAEAYLSGRETGRNLKLHNGITNSESKNSGLYLN